MSRHAVAAACAFLALLAAQAAAAQQTAQPADRSDPFQSTYQPMPSEPVAITNAVILTGTGERIDGGTVLMRDGLIDTVGADATVPEGFRVIDAEGRWVTPGLIDVHSHLGVYPAPHVSAHGDGNEMTNPVTANVWAEHAVWPQDPGFGRALAGGVTSLQILPGSANLIGGRAVTLKNVYARDVMGMKFPGAPHGLKMACGENPKRLYGQMKQTFPFTRMGNVAGYRKAWIEAREYLDKWKKYEEKIAAGGDEAEDAEPPTRDLGLETLAGVLEGEILIHNHCYRADEMAVMIEIAKEFGYLDQLAAFHHGVEAYKAADLLAEHGICGALWADWWGFKMEAYDGTKANIAIVDSKENGCAIVHSDSSEGIQRLNQEAAKAMAAGNEAGLAIDETRAIRWITANAARSLGILDRTGTLEPGKMADLVLWSGNPFSVYTHADQVYVDGALAYDREDGGRQPVSDFELGHSSRQEVGS